MKIVEGNSAANRGVEGETRNYADEGGILCSHRRVDGCRCSGGGDSRASRDVVTCRSQKETTIAEKKSHSSHIRQLKSSAQSNRPKITDPLGSTGAPKTNTPDTLNADGKGLVDCLWT